MYDLYTLIVFTVGFTFIGGVTGYYRGKYEGKSEEARKIREKGLYSIRENECIKNALKIESALRKKPHLARDSGLEGQYLADILKSGHVAEKEYFDYVDDLHDRVEKVLKNNTELAKEIGVEQ